MLEDYYRQNLCYNLFIYPLLSRKFGPQNTPENWKRKKSCYIKHKEECFITDIQILRSWFKKLRCASFFQPTSQSLDIWWKTFRQLPDHLDFNHFHILFDKWSRVQLCDIAQWHVQCLFKRSFWSKSNLFCIWKFCLSCSFNVYGCRISWAPWRRRAILVCFSNIIY